MTIVEEIFKHAKETPNLEVCGLVVSQGKKTRIIRGVNTSSTPEREFDMAPDVWLEVDDYETVAGIYHSHPVMSAKPSPADLVMCEASNLPWHIVNPNTEEYHYFEPSGYQAPYLGRPYVYGVLDCYTLARDWYQRETSIQLPIVQSKNKWWDKGENKFIDLFENFGFIRQQDKPLMRGDGLLIQYMSTVPSHCAVYLGDGTILHHVGGRASTIDNYGGVWRQCTTHHLRHSSMLEFNHG